MNDKEITDIMHSNNWDTIVYFHPGKEHRDWDNRWVAGTQTGIDSDLICIKQCDTREEGEKYLSPPGDTLSEALIKAQAQLAHDKEGGKE